MGGRPRRDRYKEVLNKQNIPVWITIRGQHVNTVDRHKAKYVLTYILPIEKFDVGGFNRYLIDGWCVPAMAIPCEDIWLIYTSVTLPADLLPPRAKRTLSAMYSCIEDYDFTDIDTTSYLRRRFKPDRNVIKHTIDITPPQEGEFPREAITAEHHTHYRPEEIWEVAKKHKTKLRVMALMLKNLRKIKGITEATVATFLAYAMVCRVQVGYLIATSKEIWSVKSATELAAKLKELSTPMKSMHNYQICDLTELFELQCLVNRGIGSVDWDAEREHRTNPNTIVVDMARVREEAKQIFSDGRRRGYKYKKMTADKYLDARWEWAPSGSVHSQYESDKDFIVGDYRQKSKFVTLNMMSKNRLRGMMKRRPQIHAWASVKYEWAKQRAIYGVDLTSMMITNFAMYRCEEVFTHRFPIGEEAAARRVHKRLVLMMENGETFCYDFDDFNAQHSTEAMRQVLKAYFDVFERDMSPEQCEAMQWVVDSLAEVYVHNNNDGRSEVYKANGTLLSGWRLTTFMNTALNYIYFKIAGCFDLPGTQDSVHNGDDVLVCIRDMATAVRIHYLMARINARAQPAKCNAYSVGEFLRVEHKIDKEEGLGAQYLTRACATLIHSRCESQEPVRVAEAVKATLTRANELEQRAKVAPELLHDLVMNALKRISIIFKKPLDAIKKIATSHVLVGGTSTEMFAPIDTKIEEKMVYEEEVITNDPDQVTVNKLMPGIIDYARCLNSIYGKILDEDSTIRRIMSATRRQISVTRKTWLELTPLPEDTRYRFGRALYKMYSDVVKIPHLEKARFVGISPIALLDANTSNFVKGQLAIATDVDYVMRVLF